MAIEVPRATVDRNKLLIVESTISRFQGAAFVFAALPFGELGQGSSDPD